MILTLTWRMLPLHLQDHCSSSDVFAIITTAVFNVLSSDSLQPTIITAFHIYTDFFLVLKFSTCLLFYRNHPARLLSCSTGEWNFSTGLVSHKRIVSLAHTIEFRKSMTQFFAPDADIVSTPTSSVVCFGRWALALGSVYRKTLLIPSIVCGKPYIYLVHIPLPKPNEQCLWHICTYIL